MLSFEAKINIVNFNLLFMQCKKIFSSFFFFNKIVSSLGGARDRDRDRDVPVSFSN